METNNYHFLNKKLEKPWSPETIEKYSDWHEIIDYVCWLIKIFYSSRNQIKRRNFRLDSLFINYLFHNQINIEKIKSVFSTSHSFVDTEISDDLKRGWYNELSFSFPIKKSTLGVSNKDIEINMEISSNRFQFPSWKIISSYYSIYFFIRSIDLIKNNNMSLEQHNKVITIFNNNVINSLSKILWKFPLNIIYNSERDINIDILISDYYKYTRYKYCNHPRAPWLSIREIIERIYDTFEKNANLHFVNKYSLLNFLHDFRIWANYIDINNLLNLYGKGYKAFLDQGLSILNFFIGGISELCSISVLGESFYVDQLQEFYNSFVSNNKYLDSDFQNTPLYQRYSIYHHFNYIQSQLKLSSKDNLNTLILEPTLIIRK